MTDTASNHESLTVEGWGSDSVIAVSFDQDDNAYAALTLLKELDAQHRVKIDEAVVVARDSDGRVVEKDRVASLAMPGMAGGGLVGLLVGIIGGPLGMLIGGMSGLAVGSLIDIDDIDQVESALVAISSSVRIGHTALLAVVSEQTPEVIDAAMKGLGGTVLRRSVSEVEAEIAAARKAERKAGRKARKELLKGRRERNKKAAHAKVEKLGKKLHSGETSSTASVS